MTATQTFLRARDFLFAHRDDYETAYRDFRWPELDLWNWAVDWFDEMARGNPHPALRIIRDDRPEERYTFAELSERSTRVARFLSDRGVVAGDRILLMVGNVPPLWITTLAAMKIGAVVVPATTQLLASDILDRVDRGGVRHVLTEPGLVDRFAGIDAIRTKLVLGDAPDGWTSFDDALGAPNRLTPARTRASDPLLLYFTSGTTARPKLVLHTHASYPVGHLSTMYWVGMREGDVHWNISSPGWAKHAWSSFFAPWNAGATVLMHDTARFKPARVLEILRDEGVATLCAPPTVWRMLILEELGEVPTALREIVSAGEPLNPEVIERVRAAWGITMRDGYGQTETTALVGNSPGQEVRAGSMGRPLPGYQVGLIDADGNESTEGEVALRLEPRPRGLMVGYLDDEERTEQVMAGGWYRTGDEASRDDGGYYHYVGRGDDVFKSSDYRISPFELESLLLEHPSVAEAAIVPSPDPLRAAVAKAFVVLKPGVPRGAETARDILRFSKERLAPYKRVRVLEFSELPKTISGKIRRVELRKREAERRATGARGSDEYFLDEIG